MKDDRHARKSAEISIDGNLLGPCGVYCGHCLAYNKGVCLGCRYQADKNAERGNDNFCALLNCAEKKGVTMCSECGDFPCKEFDPEATGMFSKTYINYICEGVKRR